MNHQREKKGGWGNEFAYVGGNFGLEQQENSTIILHLLWFGPTVRVFAPYTPKSPLAGNVSKWDLHP